MSIIMHAAAEFMTALLAAVSAKRPCDMHSLCCNRSAISSEDGLFESCLWSCRSRSAALPILKSWSSAPPHLALGLCMCLTATAGLGSAGSARCDCSIHLLLHACQPMAASLCMRCGLSHDLPCTACASWHTAQSCRS